MIRISNLCHSYGSQELFRDATFSVNSRERVGLIGRNGHGKTTLFRLILGQERQESGTIAIPKNYRIGSLEQHLSFSKSSIAEEAACGLPPGQEHDYWRAEKILMGLGFQETDLQRPPSEFSGGFQVRLNLAKVLLSEPDMLLLDEPTNYLDIISIRWLIRFLRAWKGELILITHDRSFMDSVTTHTLGIHRKRIRKIEGSTDKYYDQIAAEEEVHEKTRLNDEKRRKEVELFISRFRAKARLGGLVQSRVKTLAKQEQKHKLERIETLEFSFNASAFRAKVMMEASDLSFQYDDEHGKLFEKLGLTIAQDDRICVVGKNGRGKTTLLKVLAGVLQPGSGTIRKHPSLEVGYFEQTNTATLDPNKTIEEEILYSAEACTQQKARDIAGAMMFSGDDALKKISVLSGGEKSRVLLGKLLVSPNHLLLLDEPTNHLDMESCDSLMAAIDAFDGAVVLITHNEMFLHTLANRLVVFDRGQFSIFEGRYRQFLDEVGWETDDHSGRSNGRRKHGESIIVENKAGDKKALRQQKASLIQEKSKILKPLETRMAELETRIEQFEAEVSQKTQALVDAATSGDGLRIATLAKEEQALKARLNRCYDELDSVTREFERKSEEFAQLLENF